MASLQTEKLTSDTVAGWDEGPFRYERHSANHAQRGHLRRRGKIKEEEQRGELMFESLGVVRGRR